MSDATAPIESGRPVPLRRREWPRWTYYPARMIALLLIWPITRILEWRGSWPAAMGRAVSRMTENALPFEPAPNDVVIGSYFKSGTNWTMQTALQIAHRGHAEFEHIHDLVPWYEFPEKPAFAVSMQDQRVRAGADHGLRIIKTHATMERLGHSPSGLYIWVIRDPKDVFVSSYHFMRAMALGPLMPPVDEWLEVFLSPDAACGPWAEHVKGGWELRDRDNVLFLTYEEMKADSRGAIERMAALMDVRLTADELAEVVRRSSFEHMKQIGEKFDTIGISPPWVRPRGAMVRRGTKGGSAELLSTEDQQRIDDYCRKRLIEIGCDFPYDEHYGSASRPA